MSKIINGINYNGITYVDTGSTETQVEYITKVIEIGVWDMDATSLVTIAHGLTTSEWQSIINVYGTIRSDALSTHYYITTGGVASWVSPNEPTDAFIWNIGTTNISLHRKSAGSFDNTGFNSTSINRGWLMFTYQPST